MKCVTLLLLQSWSTFRSFMLAFIGNCRVWIYLSVCIVGFLFPPSRPPSLHTMWRKSIFKLDLCLFYQHWKARTWALSSTPNSPWLHRSKRNVRALFTICWELEEFATSLIVLLQSVSSFLSRLQYANSLFWSFKEAVGSFAGSPERCCHLICGGSRHDSERLLLRQVKWLPITEQIEMKIATLIFRCVNGLAPSYLIDRLEKYSPDHSGLRQRPGSALRLVEPNARHVRSGERNENCLS